jgi:methylmalonyl-CoA mutase C-terminal domain/subunit
MPTTNIKTTRPKTKRVLIAKVGLDGHDRGIKVVARALRDSGIEVIYLGLHNTPEEVVTTAVQEDVDAIGLSILSAAHLTLFKKVMQLLKKEGGEDIPVFGGGIIPDKDIKKLKELGVRQVFTPGTSLDAIVTLVNSLVKH